MPCLDSDVPLSVFNNVLVFNKAMKWWLCTHRMVAMQALSQDEQAARALGLSFLRAHNWPFRSSTDGHAEFLAANARLVKVRRDMASDRTACSLALGSAVAGLWQRCAAFAWASIASASCMGLSSKTENGRLRPWIHVYMFHS